MCAEKDVVFSRRAKFYFVSTGLQLAIIFIVDKAKVWFYYLMWFLIVLHAKRQRKQSSQKFNFLQKN
jgi:hypothetical protein